MDDVKRREYIKDKVEQECIQKKMIPYWYNDDEVRMEYAIHLLTDWDNYLINNKDSPKKATFITFNEALIDMCTSKAQMNLKGASVSYAKVIDKINLFLSRDNNGYDNYHLMIFQSFYEFIIDRFIDAIEKRNISDYHAYMKSVIWEGLQKYDLSFYQDLMKMGCNVLENETL